MGSANGGEMLRVPSSMRTKGWRADDGVLPQILRLVENPKER